VLSYSNFVVFLFRGRAGDDMSAGPTPGVDCLAWKKGAVHIQDS